MFKRLKTLIAAALFSLVVLFLYDRLYRGSPSKPLEAEGAIDLGSYIARDDRVGQAGNMIDQQRKKAASTYKVESYRSQLNSLLREKPLSREGIKRIHVLLKSWVAENALDAAQFMLSVDLSSQYYNQFNLAVIAAWSSIDAKKALGFVYSNFNDGILGPAVQTVLLSKCEFSTAILSCVEELPSSAQLDIALEAIADKKSSIDDLPGEGMLWAAAIKNEHTRIALIEDISNYWVEVDPESAFSWALENNDMHGLGLRAIERLAEIDPWHARQVVLAIPDSYTGDRTNIYRSIVRAQANLGNFETVVALLDEMPVRELLTEFYSGFIEQWSLKSPSEAAERALSLPESKRRDDLVSTAVRYWGEQDPSEAVNFISQIKEDDLRKSALSAAVTSWSIKDIYSATQWIEQQPSSVTMDKSLARVVLQLVGGQVSKESILALVDNISDESLRRAMVEKVESSSYVATDEY